MAAKKKTAQKAAPKKVAKKAASKKSTAKRYSEEVKAKVVAFVNDFDAKKGRGGKSAAAKKFGVTPLSVGAWVKKVTGGHAAKPAKATSKSGSIYARIGALASDIGVMEEKLAAKKAELKKLNAQI